MKILITGNSGYIGSHLTKMLIDDCHSVYGLDTAQPIIKLDNHFNYDISKYFIMYGYFDCIIHLAAKVSISESVKKPWLYYETNTIGTLNVLKNIKTKNFILASTGCAEYLNNPYAVSKRAAEDITRQYCYEHSIPYTIFRFYNVIGKTCCEPTNKDGLLHNLIQARHTKTFNLYGTDYNTKDGTAIRDYIHVNDVCSAIKEALYKPSYSIENLGTGIGTSVLEMVNLFKEVNKCDFDVVSLPRREGDLESSVLKNVSSYMKQIYELKDYLYIQD